MKLKEKESANKYIAQNNFLYFQQTFEITLRSWSFFSQKPAKNQVTMATA